MFEKKSKVDSTLIKNWNSIKHLYMNWMPCKQVAWKLNLKFIRELKFLPSEICISIPSNPTFPREGCEMRTLAWAPSSILEPKETCTKNLITVKRPWVIAFLQFLDLRIRLWNQKIIFVNKYLFQGAKGPVESRVGCKQRLWLWVWRPRPAGQAFGETNMWKSNTNMWKFNTNMWTLNTISNI